MWEEIMRLALGNGLWAVLFVFLFFYEIKDSKKREGKYQTTITALCKSLDVVTEVKTDCEAIREDCRMLRTDHRLMRQCHKDHPQTAAEKGSKLAAGKKA